jgi:LDH2 family malate/lactate/ureidoglycolate dehydrogenase
MDTLIRDVHASAVRPGVERVYVPGELEHRTREVRLRDGIPLPASLVAELNDMAQSLGLPPLA